MTRSILIPSAFAMAALFCSWLPATGSAAEPIHNFVRKHRPHAPKCSSVVCLASQITDLEADIRATGSITVKDPDVWGESNLMLYLQEYESQLSQTVGNFKPNVQAYIARSDQADLQATASLGQGLGGTKAPSTAGQSPDVQATVVGVNPSKDEPPAMFDALAKAIAGEKPGGNLSDGVGLEPTEVERQHSTFIKVNQALRRTNLADDNSRMAGYGLYLFRVPVSVLPGRETFEGHAAVVTLRAQLVVDRNHLRDTFPKLVIADVVEDLATLFHKNWGHYPLSAIAKCPTPASAEVKIQKFSAFHRNNILAAGTGARTAMYDLYGQGVLNTIFCLAKSELGNGLPRQLELRNFLLAYFTRVHLALERLRLYGALSEQIATAAEAYVSGNCELLCEQRKLWLATAKTQLGKDCADPSDYNVMAQASWCLAARAGLLNHNLQETLGAMRRNGDAPFGDEAFVEFYNPDAGEETVAAWEFLIRNKFPLHVFTLDSVVEEQNIYDAFNRRREFQLALAYGVATGEINANCALSFTRQLELDMVDLGLNRTTVAFAHGADTFGWYFYPRVQTPPEERNNLVAFARLIWSTGPTDHYDIKHRKLEPGMRECEVLIAMPSFVPQLKFDVTTNWERLTKPGCVKRTYEEMIAQGSRLQSIRMQLACVGQDQRCRPGDLERLLSRLDQLEQMLPLQTQAASIPYEYDLPGGDLFDRGNLQLRPVAQDYYGLDYASSRSTADVFITGRYFHPTQTYVIAAGSVSTPIALAAAKPNSGTPSPQDGSPSQPKDGSGGSPAASHPIAPNTPVSLATYAATADPVPPGTANPGGGTQSAPLDAEVKVLSRELLLVRLHGVNTDLTKNPISVRIGTPAGVSDELLIGYQPAQAAPPQPKPAPSADNRGSPKHSLPLDAGPALSNPAHPAGKSARTSQAMKRAASRSRSEGSEGLKPSPWQDAADAVSTVRYRKSRTSK